MSNLPLTVPDLVCTEDLDLFADETQSDLESLEQDVFHILIEDLGSNPDDIDRGIGLPNLLSAPTARLDNITLLIETQLGKDDRIDQVSASITALPAGYAFPDGLTFVDGGFLVEVDIVASQAVLGLSYAYSPASGLVPQ